MSSRSLKQHVTCQKLRATDEFHHVGRWKLLRLRQLPNGWQFAAKKLLKTGSFFLGRHQFWTTPTKTDENSIKRLSLVYPISHQFHKIRNTINESSYTNRLDIFGNWPLQVSDPGGSELRPRPALTALWSLGTLQVLPRFGGGKWWVVLWKIVEIIILERKAWTFER